AAASLRRDAMLSRARRAHIGERGAAPSTEPRPYSERSPIAVDRSSGVVGEHFRTFEGRFRAIPAPGAASVGGAGPTRRGRKRHGGEENRERAGPSRRKNPRKAHVRLGGRASEAGVGRRT